MNSTPTPGLYLSSHSHKRADLMRLERVTPGDAWIYQGPVVREVVPVWPHKAVLHGSFEGFLDQTKYYGKN